MTAPKSGNGPRTAGAAMQVWEQRKHLVKQELAAESAANDAKTSRLRALRMEKERLEAEAAPETDDAAVKAKPRIKRIVVS